MEALLPSMTIRDLDQQLKSRLRIRAAQHGRSMEEEARDILRTALATKSTAGRSWVNSIRARIEPLGGVELQTAPREPMRLPPSLEE